MDSAHALRVNRLSRQCPDVPEERLQEGFEALMVNLAWTYMGMYALLMTTP